jgi:hypothetical protein
MLQDFILKTVLGSKLKHLPKEQQEMLLNLIKKNPQLFKNIGEEIERRVKKGGEDQTKATMEVMKKYRQELSVLMNG